MNYTENKVEKVSEITPKIVIKLARQHRFKLNKIDPSSGVKLIRGLSASKHLMRNTQEKIRA